MSAADGNWKITINTPMGAQEVAASIATSGDTFTGKTSGRMGDADITMLDARRAVYQSRPVAASKGYNLVRKADSRLNGVSGASCADSSRTAPGLRG